MTSERGTSLVELLTSLLFVSILSAMSYSFARAAFLNVRLQEAQSEVQEVTVMAIDVMTRELRMAGFSAAGTPVTAVRVAGPERVDVASDLNGDGDTADSNELIAYVFNPGKHQLQRATGGGSPQPFARNVSSDGVRFSFFDETGAEIPAVPSGMPPEDRARIRRIDVRLQVELPNPSALVAAPLTSVLSSTVYLRNH